VKEACVRVVIDDLGNWGGRARVFAECEPATRTIRIDRCALALVRERGGEQAERAFIAYAIAHERAHLADFAAGHGRDGTAADRAAAERRAHALAETETGVSAASLEAWFAP
jgi:hypothetical protein